MSRQASTAAPAPDNIDVNALFQSVPHWHQKWELFQGVFTPGRNPVEQILLSTGVPLDLSGKRVLDIGAFNCCCSFECERRGAAEVIALDVDTPERVGFESLRDALRSTRVKYIQASVYHLDPKTLGQFDVVLFFGVLYHLRYPLLAIDQIRKIARGTVFVETLVIDQRFLVDGQDFQPLNSYHQALTQVPIWQFYKDNELANDSSNWFGPNIRAVIDAFESAGMSATLIREWGDRAAFQVHRGGVLPPAGPSYESKYDVVRRDLSLDEL